MSKVYLLIIDFNIKANLYNLSYIFNNNLKKKIFCFEKKIDLDNYINGMNESDYIVKEITLISKNFLNPKL